MRERRAARDASRKSSESSATILILGHDLLGEYRQQSHDCERDRRDVERPLR
jgi:hypothetical protein